jgi:hypothetical protein
MGAGEAAVLLRRTNGHVTLWVYFFIHELINPLNWNDQGQSFKIQVLFYTQENSIHLDSAGTWEIRSSDVNDV